MASTYLTRTQTTGNKKTWTFSAWIKRGFLSGATQGLISAYTSDYDGIHFYNTNAFRIYFNGTVGGQIITNRLFRDVSAWYHIVVAVDTTQATASDRVKVYVNGVQETSFSTSNYPSQNYDTHFNVANTLELGRNEGGNFYFDGQMAHVHFIDGTAYDADTFGETDSTTGIWKPKTAPSVTYGTNGFFLKFENSGAFGTDSSGNANNFTVNGTMTQTIDTPSNVFATMNPLDNNYASSTFSNGNNTIVTNSGNYTYNTATLGASSGKYYWEVKVDNTSTVDVIGITGKLSTASTYFLGTSNDSVGYEDSGVYYTNNSQVSPYGDSYTTNDIIGVAMDLDNNKLYFSKNGVFQNSGVPTSGATGTGAIDITTSSTGFYFPALGDYTSAAISTFSVNFGNGYFGTTAVSSAQNPDDGIGIFEYAVPTGYKALCTKSINAQEYD